MRGGWGGCRSLVARTFIFKLLFCIWNSDILKEIEVMSFVIILLCNLAWWSLWKFPKIKSVLLAWPSIHFTTRNCIWSCKILELSEPGRNNLKFWRGNNFGALNQLFQKEITTDTCKMNRIQPLFIANCPFASPTPFSSGPAIFQIH